MKHFFKYFIFFFAFTACNTVAHQQRKAQTFLQEHPERLAQWCADAFPAKDSVGKTDTVYQKADNTDYTKTIDSLNQLLDSAIENATVIEVHDHDSSAYYAEVKRVNDLKNQLTSLKTNYKACKPDTINVIQNHYIENTARVAYVTYQRDSLNKALIQSAAHLSDARKTARNRLWWIIGAAVIIAGLIFLLIKKIIP